MNTPFILLRYVARGVLNYFTGGVGGEIVDGSLEVAKDAYDLWSKNRNEKQRRAEVEALVQAQIGQWRAEVAQTLQEVAAGQTAEIRQQMESYLLSMQASFRQALRRPADPRGLTVPDNFALRKAEDLLRLLPAKPPRFKTGDRPLSGIDRELVELLGVGGFGEVWLARNPHFDAAPPVALKFCLDAATKHALLRETQLLNHVRKHGRHPGLVELQDTFLSADPPCLQYEYVAGGDLAGLLEEWRRPDGGLTPAQAVKIMRELAETVGFLHRLDPPIVHRDLKPANILTTRLADGRVQLKIADLGIGGLAATQRIRQTQHGMTQGQFMTTAARGSHTPLYASPQQARGADRDPRDDVHALGVIWHQLLTGDLAGAPSGLRWPARLRALGVSDGEVELLAACVETEPADRLENAAALAARLAEIAAESPARAPQPQEGIPAKRGGEKGFSSQQQPAGPAKALALDLGGGVRLEMLLVPAGSFQMGSRLRPEEVVKRYGGPAEWTKFYQAEHPRHAVTLSQPFYLAKHPVTVAQFRRFVEETGHRTDAEKGGQDFEDGKKGGYTIQSDGNWGWNESATWRNPGFPQDANHPVVLVSWNDAQAFCGWLRKKTGQTIALPTEAQWEYACRAGTETEFWWGDEMDKTGQVANVADRSFEKKYPNRMVAEMDDGHVYTSPVGIYRPNGFGLYDMIGNVWEWCADWFDENYYANSPRVDPTGPGTGSVRVLRGGSWIAYPASCRAAYRGWLWPANRVNDVGWRVAVGTL